MDRIDTATKAVDLFGAGKHGWKDGNKALGVAPTDFNAKWPNGVQEELIGGLIEAMGLVPSAADLTQVRKAIDIMIRRRAGAFCLAGGTVDAITGDFSPDVLALTDGLTVAVRFTGANTITNPTFKADGTAAVVIVKDNNQPLLPGDIAGAGFWGLLTYDATLTRWVLQNPAANRAGGHMLLRDEKAAGTGGNAVIGTQTRILNTVVVNTIPGASLAGNVITLPAGDYDVDAYAPTGTSAHRSHLYNVTDAAVAILGTSENSTTTGTNDLTITGSIVRGRISIAGAKNFELRTWCSENRTNGFGAPVSDGAGAEVFAVVSIRKVK